MGNPACNMVVGCNLDVPGIAGTPQGSVVVMTDADWAGDVKDRRRYAGIAVWVEDSVENTWYPVYESSKKQNMVCLSSGESELMALVGGASEGIPTRDQWSKMCNCSAGMIVQGKLEEKLLDKPGTTIGTKFALLHCIRMPSLMRCGF